MASRVNKLFSCSKAWGTNEVLTPCKGIKNTCKNREGICSLNSTDYSRINRDMFRACHSYAKAIIGCIPDEIDGYLYYDVSVIKIGTSQYAAERGLADGTHEIALYNSSNGELRMAKISTTGRYSTFKIGAKNDDFDVSTAVLCLIAALCEIDTPFEERMEKIKGLDDPHDYFFLCDSIYQYVNYSGGQLNVNIPDDLNIPLVSRQKVKKGLYKGTTIVGNPVIFAGESGVLSSSTTGKTHLTMKEAKAEFKDFANSRKWTEDEKSLIPSFPDDFPIPPEALKIARRYINTKKDIRPQVNFMWRGITSYGKSTGVECIACMLNVPLVRMTCHTNMETQQFLSDFVPDTTSSSISTLPDFDTIKFDPAGAYEALTGVYDENATSDMCLSAYGEVYAKMSSSTPRFKHVESNFVKGLSRGYIVEVQECSRIKDSGVLVGLNEYDRPGSVIPLIDGTYSKRDKNAMVIYTDNVGYASCRPMDPSVIRRMAFIIDSYEMPKADVIARVKYNTKVEDETILEMCYKIWEQLKEFTKEHDITEGDISVTELEMLVQAIKYDGIGFLRENVRECIISKATSDIDEQEELISFYDTMPSVSI